MLNSPHHLPTLHAPTPVAALRATVVGLVLLACLCEVAAGQEALPLAAYQDGVVLANRIDDANPATSTEITTVRSHLSAPALPPGSGDGGRLSTELAGVNYRWWLSNGRAQLGVGVGTLGYLMPSPDGRLDGPRTLTGSVPTLSLGLRYHVSPQSHFFADASGVRGLGPDPSMAQVNTKVGVEWKPAKSRLGLEQGALGFHFDSGYKLSLKARHGGLGLYLRSTF
jgi:hypothetical protein